MTDMKLKDYKGYEIHYYDNTNEFIIIKDGKEFDFTWKKELSRAEDHINFLNSIKFYDTPKKMYRIYPLHYSNIEFVYQMTFIGELERDNGNINKFSYIDENYYRDNDIKSLYKITKLNNNKIKEIEKLREKNSKLITERLKIEQEQRDIDDEIRTILGTMDK